MLNELLGYFSLGYPFALAFIAALSIPLAAFGAASLSGKWSSSSKLFVIFSALLISASLAVLLSGRTIISEADLLLNPALAYHYAPPAPSPWPGRLVTAIVLFICSGEIVQWMFRRKNINGAVLSVWLAFLAFYICSYWLGVIFATAREISLNWLYAPVAFTGVALLVGPDIKEAIIGLRRVLFVVLLISLIGAVFLPGATLEMGYKSIFPGVKFRLYGFFEHANSLGAVAAIGVIFELNPWLRKRPNFLFLSISLIALILAQSKTTFVFVLTAVFLVRWSSISQFAKGSKIPSLGMMIGLIVSLALSAILLYLMVLENRGESFFEAWSASSFSTFSGRTEIWKITWDEFVANPIFGYGPSIWDALFRYQKNWMVAGQAHNQLFQTLGQAGVFGLISLCVYVFLLAKPSFASWDIDKGLAAILFLGLMIRCFSESPLRLASLQGVELFTHLLSFAFAGSAAVALMKSGGEKYSEQDNFRFMV